MDYKVLSNKKAPYNEKHKKKDHFCICEHIEESIETICKAEIHTCKCMNLGNIQKCLFNNSMHDRLFRSYALYLKKLLNKYWKRMDYLKGIAKFNNILTDITEHTSYKAQPYDKIDMSLKHRIKYLQGSVNRTNNLINDILIRIKPLILIKMTENVLPYDITTIIYGYLK